MNPLDRPKDYTDQSALDRRFGTMMQSASVRGHDFVARQQIKHRATGEIKTGWFFFWYGEQLAVCLVGPNSYNFKLPFGQQEDLLYRWEPVEPEYHP